MNQWTPEIELKYWANVQGPRYLASLEEKAKFFNLDFHLCNVLGSDSINRRTAVDIGGGAYGGALRFTKKFRRSILVDRLVSQYVEMEHLPAYVETISADFREIPLESLTADVVFAWNVFDHADNFMHFVKGVNEAKRILKVGGLFFGSFPMRTAPRAGHPILINKEMIKKRFNKFEIQNVSVAGKPTYCDNTLFMVAIKYS